MFEQRSKDGKILFIAYYSYQRHVYTVNKYLDSDLIQIAEKTNIKDILDWIKISKELWESKNPTTQRYHKLCTGDIYDNKTETIINHSALIGLLTGLEKDDQKTIKEAIIALGG